MAKNRTCDACGARMSPWIPRARKGEQMLCKGCQARTAGVHTAQSEPVPDRIPAGQYAGGDFGWEDDLAPEGYHPLAAPLPNSVWERYAKTRALRDRPFMEIRDQKVVRNNSAKRRPKTAKLAHFGPEHGDHSHENATPAQHIPPSGPAMFQHLKDHHGIDPQDIPKTSGEMQSVHSSEHMLDDPHHSDTGHTHDAHVQPPVVPHVHAGDKLNTGGDALKDHLMHEHGMGPGPAAMMAKGDAWHNNQHLEGHNHVHGDVPAPQPQQAAENPSVPDHGHAPMTPEAMGQHLMMHHGLSESQVQHALKNGYGGGGAPQSTSEALETLHQEHHAAGYGAASTHTHGGHVPVADEGAPQYAHPESLGNQKLATHLTQHHGLTAKQYANASEASVAPVSEGNKLLHHAMHSFGVSPKEHTHLGFDVNGYEHQPATDPEHQKGHLAAHHGFTPEELAGKTPEELDTLHGAHHDPTSPLALKAGQATHSHHVHGDVGKFFAGVAPQTHHHLVAHSMASPENGGHGLTEAQANSLTDNMPDSATGHDYAQKMKAWHDAAHTTGVDEHGQPVLGGLANHQHVPTLQNNVLNPQQQKEAALKEHLKTHHGFTHGFTGNAQATHSELHDSGAFGYQGHPGHEHAEDSHGQDPEITQQLPAKYPTGKFSEPTKLHHPHPADMSEQQLDMHMLSHKKHGHGDVLDDLLANVGNSKSYTQKLQEHAQQHAMGIAHPHTHEGLISNDPGLSGRFYGGKEPEPNPDIHPHPHGGSGTLAHILTHHPNVTMDDYQDTKHHGEGKDFANQKDGMQKWHASLHAAGSLHGVPDGHTHEAPQGPHTDIPIGVHLVEHHGLSQEQVAGMTPAEFKKYHEDEHHRHDEEDLGHGHTVPGGPVRAPVLTTPNTHHAEMRSSLDHPAVHEWYHGTSQEYEGAPMNATELMHHLDRWGNYGGDDWNNHAGTHWTSLHQMAKSFGPNGAENRVIHAKLHMKNPIVYNSLNHMSHDAYERLLASGDMQDGGHFHNNHRDDSGYNHCCSDALLEYAKGGNRSDGKYGMERYRDSLRASGHDGVVVRNQADHPTGHWNAIPLSADQVEITDGHCHTAHNDERDHDSTEFDGNRAKLTQGWVHPKDYSPKNYLGEGQELPTKDEVDAANRLKQVKKPPRFVTSPRGDADPHGSKVHHHGQTWCEYCKDYADHDSDNHEDEEESEWCNVCDEDTDHDETAHPWCEHCDDYADHESKDHEDEYGEHPDTMKLDGYCPHCNTATKKNYGEDTCDNCGEDLPNWKTVQAHGKPLKPEHYQADAYGGKQDVQHALKTGDGLASHLYHHHGSDVGGKEFQTTENGSDLWDTDALELHHQHLHQDPKWAKEQGFVDHTTASAGPDGKPNTPHSHKTMYGEYKPQSQMTPAELHAHLILGHAHGAKYGTPGSTGLSEINDAGPEGHAALHEKLHAADDAVQWGDTDEDGDALPKLTHTHNQKGVITHAPKKFTPQGDDLITHLKTHSISNPKLHLLFKKDPALAEAIHQQLHDSYGPAAQEGSSKYHVHDQQWAEDEHAKNQLVQHMKEHHPYVSNGGGVWDLKAVQTHHEADHKHNDIEHTHVPGGLQTGEIVDPGQHPLWDTGHETEHIDDHFPEKEYVSPKSLEELGGIDTHLLTHHKEDPELKKAWHHEGFYDAPGTPGYAEASKQALEAHEAWHKAHPHDSGHHHDPTKKTSALTLTDLFAEVAR